MKLFTRIKRLFAVKSSKALDNLENHNAFDIMKHELEEERGRVQETKQSLAEIAGQATIKENEVNALRSKIKDYDTYIKKALKEGNDDDAAQMLVKQDELRIELANEEKVYKVAKASAARMEELYEQHVSTFKKRQTQLANTEAKVKMTKTLNTINNVFDKFASDTTSSGAFDKAKERIDLAAAKADSFAEINAKEQDSSVETIVSKYETSSATSEDVKTRLAAIKEKMK